jgi:RNA polymerase sigma-70 factor (ECF subfamily)
LSREAFAAHLERLGATDGHAEDLFLACSCALGIPGAIDLFEQHYISQVPRYVGRIDAAAHVADEAKQRVRDYLFVPKDGARPHIADYSGRGPLGSWVRVVASRFVIQMKRSQRRPADSDGDAAARLAACEPNPEVALIRARHGAELATALRAAIAALPEQERALIKLSVIDELGIDELCKLYDVHRATVARWIVRLKQEIFESAVAILRKQLRLDTEGFDSLFRAVRSQLDFSLGGLIDP